jgi:hypothetical protein
MQKSTSAFSAATAAHGFASHAAPPVRRAAPLAVAALAVAACLPIAARADGESVPAGVAPAPAEAPDESGLRAADREQERILVEQDAAANREFVHGNYVQNGPTDRVLRRRQAIDRFGSGSSSVDRFERTIEAITITGNVGVVTGGEQLSPALAAQGHGVQDASVVDQRFTNVYVYEGARWRLLARQVTPIGVTTPRPPAPKLGPAPDPVR